MAGFEFNSQLLFAFVFTAVGALSTVRAVIWLRRKDYVSPLVARKLMHISTGPVFILCWLLFPRGDRDRDESSVPRVLAALVPGSVTAYFVLAAAGLVHNPTIVQTSAWISLRTNHARCSF